MSDDPVAGTAAAAVPPAPMRAGGPPQDWVHRQLYERVIAALYALPGSFQTSLNIAGVRVTDLYTLNSALGASIEQSVVENLNSLRVVWDPDSEYRLYSFVRQNQVFPDVRLQTETPEPKIIMGIELKGWFALSKEGEPSFRYTVTPDACAPADLMAVFPWVLDEVISGKPKLMRPFISEARHAAEHRNYYWSYMRGVTGDSAVVHPATHRQPYPRKSEKFNDHAPGDRNSGNFGRVARGQFMTTFIDELNESPVAGIPLGAWQRFFKIFSEDYTEERVRRSLARIQDVFSRPQEQDRVEALIAAIIALMPNSP